ncbi:MAG: hypothetical protein K2X03_23120 [Bryobacteraceae bacterium]|nr:hypothetical protein [Bryobacteraceae bacterium]
MSFCRIFFALALPVLAQHHPLDGLTTSEYWAVYDTIQKAGHATPDSYFPSILLRAPAKDAALAWRPGQPMPREADVIMLEKEVTYEARVDITGKKLVSWKEMKGVQAPFLDSEMSGAGEAMKKDPRIVEALKKRGITDLNLVRCSGLPVSYVSVPAQATARIGFGGCTEIHGSYHGWGRSIEGLTARIDVVNKKVLEVIDTGAVPVGAGAINYEELPENPRAGTTPILMTQPMGAAYKIDKGEVSWQNWRFRFRIDQRLGVVLNLVRYTDGARQRSVMYEGSISELFVPYMDPANGWNNRVFIDAGEFYADGGLLQPLKAGLDCPATATYFDALMAGERGTPKVGTQRACLFERASSDPAWRHGQGPEVYGRPSRELVLRSAAVIGNYDYIMDWRFLQDGTIDVAVGATGVIETKSVAEKTVAAHGDTHAEPEYGKLVAPGTLGVNHDHFFSYRLDLDVDGARNSFMAERLVQKLLPNDPMRKSIWVVEPSMAKTEQEAILDIKLDRPAMWMFVNPNVKGPLGYPTGYEIMAGATATSLLSPDDPPQKLGAFSAHQFWVTPYDTNQRYASGVYPTASQGNDGLADWTKANRPISNTDIVGWYTLGFHHVPRAEDWPVMPTMWHSFQIRPFHFFGKNPVLDLPKSLQ